MSVRTGRKKIIKPNVPKLVERFQVAVFPLLDHVLFPGTTLPLRIFEARYALMLADILARDLQLAVALVTPKRGGRSGDEGDEFYLNTVCGVGMVEVLKNYGDGRSDIFVHGKRRIKLHEFVQKEPYFIMEASALTDSRSSRERKMFEEFRELVKTWVFLCPLFEESEALLFDQFESAGALSDFFVFHYLKKALDKQTYLNCLNPEHRTLMLTEYLRTDLKRLSRQMTKKMGKNRSPGASPQTEKSRLIH